MPSMTRQTRILIDLMDELREREAASKRATAAATTPAQIKAAEEEEVDVATEWMMLRGRCRVMHDTPTEEIVPILNTVVTAKGMKPFADYPDVDGPVAWCEEVAKLGGPTIDPEWLRAYLKDYRAGRVTEVDPIVHEGLIIQGARFLSPKGVVCDSELGRPIKMS